jgi:uncharacterized OB-fold protein
MNVLEPPGADVPAPVTSALTDVYWDGCRRGELLFQRCMACGAANFKPAHRCRSCLSDALEWQKSAGQGLVYSWTVVWRGPTADFRVPYAPAIVELDEGYQMMSAVVGCAPADVRIGQRVAVEFHPVASGFRLPYFRPTQGATVEPE